MKKIATIVLLLLISISLFAFSFEELEKSMEENNLDYLKAKQEQNLSLLDVKDAKSNFFPSIDLTCTASYLANPIDPVIIESDTLLSSLGLSSLSTSGQGDDYITLYQGQESAYYQFKLDLTQPVFTWGKLSKALDIYNAVYELKSLQVLSILEKNKNELKTRIAILHYIKKTEEVLKEQKELAEKLVTITKDSFEENIVLEVDVAQAEVTARELDVAIAQLEEQKQVMLDKIQSLSGIEDLEADDISFEEEEDFTYYLNFDPKELEIAATNDLKTTFRILSKLKEIALLTRDVSNASVNWKPDFAFVASLDYTGARMPFIETDWYRKDDYGLTLTLAVKSTVFDGGKAIRDVKRKNLDVDISSIDSDKAKQEILSTLRENLAKMKLANTRIRYYDAKEEVAIKKVDHQKILSDLGSGSQVDLIKAELEVNNAKLERLKEQIDLVSTFYIVNYLI